MALLYNQLVDHLPNCPLYIYQETLFTKCFCNISVNSDATEKHFEVNEK